MVLSPGRWPEPTAAHQDRARVRRRPCAGPVSVGGRGVCGLDPRTRGVRVRLAAAHRTLSTTSTRPCMDRLAAPHRAWCFAAAAALDH